MEAHATVLKQLPIDEESKRNLIRLRVKMFWDTSDNLAEQMFNGEISIGEWQELFKSEIRQLHTSTAAIGKGGWDEMGPRDWGRLGTPLRKEYAWQQRFAEYVSENRDDISLEYIQNRARLYGYGAEGTAVMIESGFYLYDLLPYIPKDGTTECLNKCHCSWVLDVVDQDGPWRIVECTWVLGAADHCSTCLERDGHKETIRVPPDVEIPSTIGGY